VWCVVANGHAVVETVAMTTNVMMERQKMEAERAAYIELMRRRMEEEKERRRALIAEVGSVYLLETFV